jgi:hypothetical protein
MFERRHDFGLRPVALENGSLRLFDSRERLVDDFRPNPAIQCVGANAGKPFRE